VRRYAGWYDLALVLGGSLFIALSAHIAVPLPFSPVPITGQTLAVLMVGALLGSRHGALAVLAYLAEGMAGLPVFAGGVAGPARLLGPTGGYLLGFVVAAWVTGWLAERGWDRRVGTTLLMMVAGNAVIYAVAVPYLASLVGGGNALALGFYPFIAGDVVKTLVAAAFLPMGWKLLQTQ
jgi:biotin transport system substrate-specific component